MTNELLTEDEFSRSVEGINAWHEDSYYEVVGAYHRALKRIKELEKRASDELVDAFVEAAEELGPEGYYRHGGPGGEEAYNKARDALLNREEKE